MWYLVFLCILPSILLTAVILPFIERKSEELYLLDIPNKRKTHTIPVSRLGGSCFLPILVVTGLLIVLISPMLGFDLTDHMQGTEAVWKFVVLLMGAIILYITGLIDDIIGLGYKVKFLAQIVSAFCLCFGIMFFECGFSYQIPLVALLVVYIINSINLIDGIDGLASGFAILTLVVILIIDIYFANLFEALLSAALLGIIGTFFYYNTYSWSHKIFMGDTGSLSIGFFLSYLICDIFTTSCVEDKGSQLLGILALSPLLVPMADVIRVFTVRILKGANPFIADKNHIHHVLMRDGFTAYQTLWILLGLGASMVAFFGFLVFVVLDFDI